MQVDRAMQSAPHHSRVSSNRAQCHEKQFRGGLVVKAHGLVEYSTLGLRVIKKKEMKQSELSIPV